MVMMSTALLVKTEIIYCRQRSQVKIIVLDSGRMGESSIKMVQMH